MSYEHRCKCFVKVDKRSTLPWPLFHCPQNWTSGAPYLGHCSILRKSKVGGEVELAHEHREDLVDVDYH